MPRIFRFPKRKGRGEKNPPRPQMHRAEAAYFFFLAAFFFAFFFAAMM
jgi:hypothetical protein